MRLSSSVFSMPDKSHTARCARAFLRSGLATLYRLIHLPIYRRLRDQDTRTSTLTHSVSRLHQSVSKLIVAELAARPIVEPRENDELAYLTEELSHLKKSLSELAARSAPPPLLPEAPPVVSPEPAVETYLAEDPILFNPAAALHAMRDIRRIEALLMEGSTRYAVASSGEAIAALPVPHRRGLFEPVLAAFSIRPSTAPVDGDHDIACSRFVPLGIQHTKPELARAEIVLTTPVVQGGRVLRPLHPVRVAPQAELRFPGRILENGYPSSGNVVLLNIIQELVGDPPRPQRGPLEHYFEEQAYGSELFHFQVIPRFLSDLEVQEVHGQVFDFDTTWIRLELTDGRFFAFESAVSSVYRAEFWTTHEFPSDAKIERFLELGYKTVFAIRHPLDVVLSLAHKLAPGQEASLLERLDWFRATVDTVVAYLSQYHRLGLPGLSVRYEDLLTEPASTIRALAAALELPVTEQQANDIWQKYGFRPLQPKHYWQPGFQKWCIWLSGAHHAALEGSGLSVLLTKLGYPELRSADFQGPALSSPTTPLTPSDAHMWAVADLHAEIHYGTPRTFRSQRIIEGVEPGSNCRYASDSPQAIERILSDPRFTELLAAFSR